jgi:DNA repair exonuclease SbcCD ATPase subunit
MKEAKIFLDKKQDEHFKEFGLYADVNSKIAEWMQEYSDKENIKDILIVRVNSHAWSEEFRDEFTVAIQKQFKNTYNVIVIFDVDTERIEFEILKY